MPATIEAEAQATDIQVKPEHHADPVTTNLDDVYKKALETEQIQKQGKATVKTKAKAEKPVESSDKAEISKEATSETKEATKPTSAWEAALEAPPKEDKTEETDVLADLDPKNPNWEKARGKISKLDTENKRLSIELAEAKKGDPKIGETLETLKREKAELESKLAEYKDSIVAVNIELEPEFRKEFVEGRKTLVNKASEKIKAYGGNHEMLVDALSLPEGRARDMRIQEAMGEMEDVPKGKILSIIAEIEARDEKANDIRANSQQAWEKYKQTHDQNAQKQNEQIEVSKKAEWEKITGQVMDKHPFLKLLPSDAPDAESWNNVRTQARNEALVLHSHQATPQQTFEAAFKGRMYDTVEKFALDTYSENKELKKQLAEFDTAQPDIKGGKRAAASKETDPGKIYYDTLAKAQGGGDDD